MVTQEEIYTQKGRVIALKEKLNTIKEKYTKLSDELIEIYSKPELQYNKQTQTIYGVKFYEWNLRIKEYIEDLNSLNKECEIYIKMLEKLFKNSFPDMEFEKK